MMFKLIADVSRKLSRIGFAHTERRVSRRPDYTPTSRESFAPKRGSSFAESLVHGLRPWLHSFAAARLTWMRQVLLTSLWETLYPSRSTRARPRGRPASGSRPLQRPIRYSKRDPEETYRKSCSIPCCM